MGLLHRKSRTERIVGQIATGTTNAMRRGAVRNSVAAAAAAIGVSAASAVVSSRRQKDKK
ncbi:MULTISPECIES: hypothetical protein [unclassified Kribbella]|uniref:hypothetical protein n=1 Tax=unclassified Kribbella TaxID=2644121 RepID=UPI0033C3EF72|nr:hypothetical protein OG817_01345 [Kribbella sp. NBC_00889]